MFSESEESILRTFSFLSFLWDSLVLQYFSKWPTFSHLLHLAFRALQSLAWSGVQLGSLQRKQCLSFLSRLSVLDDLECFGFRRFILPTGASLTLLLLSVFCACFSFSLRLWIRSDMQSTEFILRVQFWCPFSPTVILPVLVRWPLTRMLLSGRVLPPLLESWSPVCTALRVHRLPSSGGGWRCLSDGFRSTTSPGFLWRFDWIGSTLPTWLWSIRRLVDKPFLWGSVVVFHRLPRRRGLLGTNLSVLPDGVSLRPLIRVQLLRPPLPSVCLTACPAFFQSSRWCDTEIVPNSHLLWIWGRFLSAGGIWVS